MTKSVKEKTRIEKIRYCKQHNIPVTSDLIKIDFTFKKKNFRKRKRETDKNLLSTVYNPIWLKSLFINQLELIKSKLVPIVQSLEVYNLTVYFNISIKFIDDTDDLDNFLCAIDLYCNKQFIGHLTFNNELRNKRSFGKIFKTTKKSIDKNHFEDTIQYLQFLLDNTDLSIFIYRPYDLSHIPIRQFENFFRRNKNNKFSQIIKKMDFFRNIYTKQLNINLEINITYIFHKSIIDIELSYYPKIIRNSSHYYTTFQIDLINYSELDFIKNLIQLEAINVDICDEDFTLENLSEIENLIKMSSY